MVCRNITGNGSDPINIIFNAKEQTGPTDNQHTTENLRMHNSDTNTAYIISISSLATALTVCVVVFIAVIAVISRSKSKTQRSDGSIHDEPMYEDVTGPSPSVRTINTQLMAIQKHLWLPSKLSFSLQSHIHVLCSLETCYFMFRYTIFN